MEMKTENLTRKEAVLACLNGHKIGHKEFDKGTFVELRRDGFVLCLNKGEFVCSYCFPRKEGYSIIQEPLTYATIRKECEPMKHLLVDITGNKRLYLGFTRGGSLACDCWNGKGLNSFEEYQVRGWKIEPYEGE
jgi:hypothetical protein